MKNRLPLVLLLLLCAAPKLAHAQDACTSIVNNSCQACHTKARICQAIGDKSKAAWQGTVKRMINKGATLSGRDEQALIDCLASAQPGADFVCKP